MFFLWGRIPGRQRGAQAVLVSGLALDGGSRTTTVLRVLPSPGMSGCQQGWVRDPPQAFYWMHLKSPPRLQPQPRNELQTLH